MKPAIRKIMWPSALIAVTTLSFAAVYAQKQDKEKPAEKPEGGAFKQGGMDQMGGGTGMT